MIYLASPYTHPDPLVMEQRHDAACRAAGALMAQGHVVFSPIAHTHPIRIRCGLTNGWEFWARQDTELLLSADRLVVLRLDGWDRSRGVSAEIAIANEHGIPIEYMEPV